MLNPSRSRCSSALGRAVGGARRLWRAEEGQDLVEYGLVLLLVALVAVASIQTIGNSISNVFTSASTTLTSAT